MHERFRLPPRQGPLRADHLHFKVLPAVIDAERRLPRRPRQHRLLRRKRVPCGDTAQPAAVASPSAFRHPERNSGYAPADGGPVNRKTPAIGAGADTTSLRAGYLPTLESNYR